MDFHLIARLIRDKLRDRTTYVLALIVGTLINAYGQLLVPWFRTGADPFAQLAAEMQVRPGLTTFSIFLAFAFPFCVGIYSAVAARYKNRRVESIADFPERKPDPVFRARRDGALVEVGENTQRFFARYRIDCAQRILGDEAWEKICSDQLSGERIVVHFEAEGEKYLVTHAPTLNDQINIYMTRLSGLRLEA
ncbi:MAG TPA: hypothetical protein VLA52_13435 [Thermohalobaculum sp.]|nr:hypothetical protein [Thermohalobaculum sp.]